MIECLKMHKENFDYCLGELIRESEEKDKEIERLHSIIKEVRKYITSYESIEAMHQCEHNENNKGLDNDTIIEMTNRHLKVHDKILEILDKENENEKV